MYDAIIIGGGPAGLSAALYAFRYGLGCLVVEKLYPGGQIVNAAEVENYPGAATQPGMELAAVMEGQVRQFPELITIVNESAQKLELTGAVKTVEMSGGIYEGRTVILATGQNPRPLGVPGEDRLRGLGVSYCATCDGNFFRGRDVAVVGGGNTAVTDAAFLSRICKTVTVIHRRERFRASAAEVEKTMGRSNVHTRLGYVVTELTGEQTLESVQLENPATGEKELLPVAAVFVAVGNIPNTGLFRGQVELDEAGYVTAGEDTRANLPGVFAAGDIRRKGLRQVVTAAADGAVAAFEAMEFLNT